MGKRLSTLFVSLLCIVLIICMVVGCGQSVQKTDDPNKTEGKTIERRISMGTGGMSGTYYPIGAAICKIISENVPNITVTAEATGGAIQNIKLLGKGDIELGMAGSMATDGAIKGPDEFFDRSYSELLALFATYPEIYQFAVRKDSGIKTLNDLKGKRVVVGAPGSGSLRGAARILNAHGITYDDINEEFAPFSDACSMLSDGQTDCIIVCSGIPTAGIMEISASIDVELLEMDINVMNKVIEEEPFFSIVTVPAGAYDESDKEFQSLATPCIIVTAEGIFDEDEAYNMVKAVYDNTAFFGDIHVQGKYITIENALQGIPIKLHPGAKKYFTEQGLIK